MSNQHLKNSFKHLRDNTLQMEKYTKFRFMLKFIVTKKSIYCILHNRKRFFALLIIISNGNECT